VKGSSPNGKSGTRLLAEQDADTDRHRIIAKVRAALASYTSLKRDRAHRERLSVPNSILCIGSVYVDINCLAFPCENGLPTESELRGEEYEVVPGGSVVNFARFGHSLGLDTVLAAKVGDDHFGELLHRMLKESGVRLVLKVDPESQTDLGLNFIAPNGASVLTVVGSANRTLTASDLPEFIDKGAADISQVYIGGAFKFPHLVGDLKTLAEDLRARKIVTILDHGRVPEKIPSSAKALMRSLSRSVDVYLTSRDEFLTLWETDSLDSAARRARDNNSANDQVIVVTDGAAGAEAFAPDGHYSARAYGVEVRNTVGAGDSFNAGFIASESLGMADRLNFACAAAAVKISTPDLPTLDNVHEFLRTR
jgi:sugar/nucleoside kinase (ribokinase family)